MTVRPIGRNISIQPEEKEAKTSSGIIVATYNAKEKPCTGRVVKIGGAVEGCKEGDIIMFDRYGVTEQKVGDTTYYFISDDSVMAVIG